MPATVITTSPDIAILDLNVYAECCSGRFFLDISPSTYIDGGKVNVLGANIKITNPLGVVIKNFGTNYEISPALSAGMDAPVIYAVPTVAGGYQLGNYTFEVELFDSLGNRFTNSKQLNLCAPTASKPTLKYANLSAQLIGNCQDGKMAVIVDGVPNYKGKIVQSQTNLFTLDYPTASGEDPIVDYTQPNIHVTLYEGVYKITGTICAYYNLGDHVYVSILYKIKKEHNQKCIIDFCCVNDKFSELRTRINSDCGDEEKANTASIMVEALFLLENAKLAATCGEDPSDIITALETLLGCSCTCNCNEGTPIINNAPTADVIIDGCGFTSQKVGLTTTYTLFNYDYTVAVEPNGGALTITPPTVDSCAKTQTLNFNVGTVYAQIYAAALLDSCAWAAVIKRCIAGLDVTCLGITPAQYAALTFAQLMQLLFNLQCAGSGSGATCTAKLSDVDVAQDGLHIKFRWTEDGFTQSVNIYLNGILIANVLAGVGEYDYPIAADRQNTYILTPMCSTGVAGVSTTGVVSTFRPTFVAPPVIYSPYLQGVCPYDITTNVQAVPLGISLEFHRQNNPTPISLVPDPTNALQGTYFVFGKDDNGFYSEGVQMSLVCDASGSYSAPQNLQVVPQFGGTLVKFQSAAYPPPLNSYTVKRRLKSDSDISANYTTIGSPSWNASISRWVISDNSAVANQLYVYRAIANAPSTAPYLDAEYANIICPTMSLTEKSNLINYMFFPIGGAIDKIEVTIYSDNGVTALHTDTHLSAYPSTISGSFVYLDPNKQYWIGVKAYIGTYSKTCSLQTITTLKSTATLTVDYVGGTWLAELSNPISMPLTFGGEMRALGSNSSICSGTIQTDTIPSLTIPTGSLSASSQANGLTYLSTYYHLENSLPVSGYGNKASGSSFTLDHIVISVVINHISCGFYPA